MCALFCLSSLLLAANFKLYLTDGNFHVVREYKVEGDRVRFYSIERSDWEEMPASLVDLKRTEGEKSERAAALAEDAKSLAEEEKAVRDQEKEVHKIPQDPGVYALDDKQNLRIFKLADSTVHTDKGRTVLKTMVGLPMIPGKATVEVPGEHSANFVTTDRPELYIQLSAEQRFGIIKLTPHKGVRISERVSVIPVSKEYVEEMDEIEIFRKQLSESGLFRIWPVKPLEPGEYAVVEYTSGKLNAQLWDFAYKK
jgi:hypothetical protein